MSRLACKSSWPTSGYHHLHPGLLKNLAPLTGTGIGNESLEGTGIGKGHTALGTITVAVGIHQKGNQRMADDQAVKVIERGPPPGKVDYD